MRLRFLEWHVLKICSFWYVQIFRKFEPLRKLHIFDIHELEIIRWWLWMQEIMIVFINKTLLVVQNETNFREHIRTIIQIHFICNIFFFIWKEIFLPQKKMTVRQSKLCQFLSYSSLWEIPNSDSHVEKISYSSFPIILIFIDKI